MRERLSIESLIDFAWITVKRHFSFFLGLTTILGLMYAILTSLQFKLGNDLERKMSLLLVGSLLQFWISLGVIRIVLGFCDGRLPHVTELFVEFRHLGQLILASIALKLITYLIIAGIATMVLLATGFHPPSLQVLLAGQFDWKSFILGLSPPVLLAAGAAILIPLIFLHVRLYFFPYYIVDQDAGPLEALGRSWDATRGAVFKLILFFSVIGVLNLFGAIALMVLVFTPSLFSLLALPVVATLLLTIPMSLLAMAAAYRFLAGQQIIEENDKSREDAGQ